MAINTNQILSKSKLLKRTQFDSEKVLHFGNIRLRPKTEVKLSLCLTKHQAMKMHAGVKVQHKAFLISGPHGRKIKNAFLLSHVRVSFTFPQFTPEKKKTWRPIDYGEWGVDSPRGSLYGVAQGKFSAPAGNLTRVIQPTA
jgi:hypothetical protein